jgi:hypothetical protein
MCLSNTVYADTAVDGSYVVTSAERQCGKAHPGTKVASLDSARLVRGHWPPDCAVTYVQLLQNAGYNIRPTKSAWRRSTGCRRVQTGNDPFHENVCRAVQGCPGIYARMEYSALPLLFNLTSSPRIDPSSFWMADTSFVAWDPRFAGTGRRRDGSDTALCYRRRPGTTYRRSDSVEQLV